FRKPAQRPATCHFLDQHHVSLNAFLFAIAVKVPLFRPTQSVAANIVALSSNLTSEGWVSFQRHGTGKKRCFDFVLLEQAQQSPNPRSPSIFPLGLRLKATRFRRLARRYFSVGFVSLVSIHRRELGALLVVDDQGDGNLAALWPFHSG